ncbi:valine--pyruvate transaminase [Algibacillus agarilyticus]|uniref:valine--pyruvate transaminase n=1 Tax=Algibacillus agarilyticus TaxID=2234133 RepID=UPI000DD092B0|nr:valine--pyruvate transaminase [Algibacillus agarilyticus]
MKLSKFGQQLTPDSGIVNLMADLGNALNVNPDILFLGGGNPAQIPEFENIIAEQLQQIAQTPAELHKLIGIYQSPQGAENFISALATYLQDECGWPVTEDNIAVTNGSQSAFFILLNMLAGEHANNAERPDEQGQTVHKKIMFPLVPEYLGYSDQALAEHYFAGVKPKIELQGEHFFKYKIDFDALTIDPSVAALCVSRPTNPTGNMVSEAELSQLSDLAKQHQIPLIIDCAYGEPFPGIVYQESHYQWQDEHILVLSLSKLGLPAVRTGIVIAKPEVVKNVVKANTIMSLANGNLGPELMTRLLDQGLVSKISKTILQPFYQKKCDYFISELINALKGVPFRFHQPEGAFFIWLWLEGLPVHSSVLYQNLKNEGVLVMDGEPFFFALPDEWPHKHECLRLSYCQSETVLSQAAGILGREIKKLYPSGLTEKI